MLTNLWDLRDKVFEGLELKAEIIETQGQGLDIGERFKVRFTVTHRLFDPRTGCDQGNVRFLDCRLILEGTAHAIPIEADPLTLGLGDLTAVGQCAEQVVEFEALGKLPNGPWGVDPLEAYVEARVSARFDLEGFLHFWQDKTFWTQIEAG